MTFVDGGCWRTAGDVRRTGDSLEQRGPVDSHTARGGLGLSVDRKPPTWAYVHGDAVYDRVAPMVTAASGMDWARREHGSMAE
jgi:hypothetical protein